MLFGTNNRIRYVQYTCRIHGICSYWIIDVVISRFSYIAGSTASAGIS
jgi:hypothetical protein